LTAAEVEVYPVKFKNKHSEMHCITAGGWRSSWLNKG